MQGRARLSGGASGLMEKRDCCKGTGRQREKTSKTSKLHSAKLRRSEGVAPFGGHCVFHYMDNMDKGSPARFARVLAVTFEQDVCVSVCGCLVAFPRKRPTHPDRIADVPAQVVTY